MKFTDIFIGGKRNLFSMQKLNKANLFIEFIRDQQHALYKPFSFWTALDF